MSLITLQFLDMDDFFDEFLKLDEIEPINDQFDMMGYESLYCLKNLGTVCFGIFLPIVLWFLVYSIISFFFPKYEPFRQKVSDIVFCDKSFAFLNETYILLAMCAAINLHYF